jgi:hypothetical protein
MNSLRDVVFATNEEQREKRDLLDHARQDGYEVITVPENVRREIEGAKDVQGEKMRDVGAYTTEYNESFQYEWIEPEELTEEEKAVWKRRQDILDLLDDLPHFNNIRISEQMRVTGGEGWKTRGTWKTPERWIVIHRPVLQSLEDFGAVLLHELAHPRSGAADQTREFEKALTDMLGECAFAALREDGK